MAVTDLVRTYPGPATSAARQPQLRAVGTVSRNWVRTYRAVLIVGDAAGAVIVAGLAIALAGAGFSWALAGLPVAWALVAGLTGAYRSRVLSPGAHDLRPILLAGVVLLAAVSVLEVAGISVRDTTVIAGILLVTASASAVRFATRLTINARRRAGECTQRVLVVGEAAPVTEMVERLRRTPHAIVPIAVVVPSDQVELVRDLDLPVAVISEDDPETTVTAAAAHLADGVLLVPGGTIPTTVWRGIARACEWHKLQLMFSPAVVDVATTAPMMPVAGVPVLAVPRPGPAGAGQVVKVAVDRVGAAVGLVLIAPVLLVIAFAIRLDTNGPIVFRQVRIGANGVPFKIFKFRTMHTDAEQVLARLRHLNESEGPLFKLRVDPRVTRVGRVMRKLSLDELPQLLNVLVGHMSLVGPRPPLPSEVAAYTRVERRRLLVKPGLTGLWQVGGRSELGWVEAVQLDIRYVESWSLPLDLRILARTVPAVMRGTGAF